MLAEIATGDPLFRGDSEIDQLFHIFRTMGIPTEKDWPGVTKLRDYNPKSFPSWHTNRLCSQEKIVGALDAKGLDLLAVSERRVPPFFSFSRYHCCLLKSTVKHSLGSIITLCPRSAYLQVAASFKRRRFSSMIRHLA